MFLTVAYLVVDLYNGYQRRRRSSMFLKLLRRHLEHTSVVLRKLGHGSGPSASHISRLVRANPAGWLENVLYEEKSKQILSVSPKVTLGLDGWVSYLDSQDIPILPTYPVTDYSYVLFETSQADDEQDYLQQSFSVPVAQRVKVVDCCEPIAWKSGLPFGIVARCSSDNLVKLVDAHLQGTLCLDDMLELHQMMCVEVEGSAERLLQFPRPGSQIPTPSRSPRGSDGSIRGLWETARSNSYTGSTEDLLDTEPLPPGCGEPEQQPPVPEYRGSEPEQQPPVPEYRGSEPEQQLPLPEYRGSEPEQQQRVAAVQTGVFHADKPVNGVVQQLVRGYGGTDTHPTVHLNEYDYGLCEDDADMYEGSNESLASSVADLREVRAEADQFAQTVEEVMTLDGDVISDMMDSLAIEGAGEGVGGESLSGPVEELAPETLTPLKRRQTLRGKPPNVLVYCGTKDSTRQFEAVKAVIEKCLNPARYVIYHLKHKEVKTTPWSENTALLVLASEKAYDGMDEVFLQHFRNSGTIISFGCAFDTLFVERIQTDTNIGVMSLTAFKQWRDVKVICGRHVYKNTNTLLTDSTLRTLATDQTSGYPVILEANHDLSTGVAILCQVLLEKDPMELAVNPEVFAMLKKSSTARFGMLRHLLDALGLDTTRPDSANFTFGVLVTKKPDQKDGFLRGLRPRLNDGVLRSRKLSIRLLDSVKETPSPVTAETFPLVTNVTSTTGKHSFNMTEFHKYLETERLGHVLIYADVMATTMNVIDVLMFPVPRDLSVVVVAGQQTAGVGRGGNQWLSPPGCALFSLLVRVDLSSELGRRVSFLQHMAALAVVQGIITLRGYENLDLRLKWPNDIYFGSSLKLGGIVVNSSIMQTTIHANIGIGFNVDNSDPTTCVNDAVRQYNLQHGTSLPDITREVVIARTLNWLEILIKSFEKHGSEKFLHLYYKRWLHGDARVRVASSECPEPGPELKVMGLDDYGYLQVETPDGDRQSLHPDGNSFDMMKGLIAPKVR